MGITISIDYTAVNILLQTLLEETKGSSTEIQCFEYRKIRYE
jgi:hypothetical protein